MEDRLKGLLKNIKMNESFLSMVMGVVTIFIVGLLVFNFYRETSSPDIADIGDSVIDMTEKIGGVPVMEGEDGEKYPINLDETYIVKEGDHLWKIAEENYGSGYNWVDIAKASQLANAGVIYVGQELKMPKVAVRVLKTADAPSVETDVIGSTSYKVVKGDNLWSISVRAYQDGYMWPRVAEANKLADPDVIEVGQVLVLPR